jgi:hypothetical protein
VVLPAESAGDPGSIESCFPLLCSCVLHVCAVVSENFTLSTDPLGCIAPRVRCELLTCAIRRPQGVSKLNTGAAAVELR